jgi:hypothetical protein
MEGVVNDQRLISAVRPQKRTFVANGLVDKLKQLGSEIRQAVGAATSSPQPVPVPVRVRK